MEKRLLLVLMSCGIICVTGTLNPYKSIYFVNQNKTFDEAQQYCRDNYDDLLTLWERTEMEEVFARQNFTTPFAWIGLKRTSQKQWRWALPDPEFYKEGEAEYRNWGPGEPTNGNGEYCSVMDNNGYIRDTPYWTAWIFICYNGQSNAESKYILVNEPKKCREAQIHCREFYTELVCVRNPDENRLIQKLIPAGNVAYIGLFQDQYAWVDNSPSPYRNWDLGEPYGLGECVVQQLQQSRLWDNHLCSSHWPFFCQTVPKMKWVLRLELKSDENVNPNDPVMKATILQKIQQKLISQGLSGQWRKLLNGDVFQRIQERAGASLKSACPQHNHY